MALSKADLRGVLSGISGILVTPYDENGDVAPKKLSPIIDRALAAGVHFPVVNGNTGEFYALTTDEAIAMARSVAEMLDGRAWHSRCGCIGKGIGGRRCRGAYDPSATRSLCRAAWCCRLS